MHKTNKTYLVANTKCVEAPDTLGIRCSCWEAVDLAVEAKNRHGVFCVDGRVAGEGIFVDLRLRVVKFQRRRGVVFRVVSWRGEVARRRKSHGGGGSTSGGFVGWKNEQGFDVCGSVGRFRLTR